MVDFNYPAYVMLEVLAIDFYELLLDQPENEEYYLNYWTCSCSQKTVASIWTSGGIMDMFILRNILLIYF